MGPALTGAPASFPTSCAPRRSGAWSGRPATSAAPPGRFFVVYHGQVSADTPVAVEVCVPIASAPDDDVPARVEPAHREAYATLRKEQVVFPEIQGAYMAVDEWVSGQGLTVADDPREVYFTDFMAAGPRDEVCDVAFPIG